MSKMEIQLVANLPCIIQVQFRIDMNFFKRIFYSISNYHTFKE